jgi:hypothetical protein
MSCVLIQLCQLCFDDNSNRKNAENKIETCKCKSRVLQTTNDKTKTANIRTIDEIAVAYIVTINVGNCLTDCN